MPHTSKIETVAHVQRKLREQFAPAKDDPDAVAETCVECGRVFWRRKGKRRHYCPKCGQASNVLASVSMSKRSGPTYEKAVRGQLAFWTAEAERLGL